MTESVKERSVIKAKLVCYYDELSENSYFNRILKTTAELLLKMDIPRQRKRELRSLMTYFTNVEILDFHEINWRIRYNRNNSSYLLAICLQFGNKRTDTYAIGRISKAYDIFGREK